jgi:radical SAM protein with 4Fe4S-binding SPASM domain
MNPKNTIKKNIKRRTLIVDHDIKMYKNLPLPTWIELSLIDVCNRSCTFCPKSDPTVAPDTYQKMSRLLINKLTTELKKMKYRGAIALCGYGEPLLHKDILYITKKLAEAASVEIVTNGDVLTSKTLKNLYLAKASRVLISMYDGPEQIKKFKKIIKLSKVPDDFVILRDRWYDKDSNFGVKLTNRTGTIKIGNQIKNDFHTTCYYPSYQFLIDWNGDVFLCPQDWQRRVTMGNMMQEDIYSIWSGKIMSKYRKQLLNGKRTSSPCNSCNAQGTLLGQTHAKIWREIYKS